MSKNLFESTIDSIKTPENTIYMEAVVELFNTLFEDQIGEMINKDAFDFYDMSKFIPANPRGALNYIAQFVADRGIAVQQSDNSRDKFMKTYVPEEQITKLSVVQRVDTTNSAALKGAKEALSDLAHRLPNSQDAFKQVISNMTKVYANNDRDTIKNIAKLLTEFFKAVQMGYKWVTTEYSQKKTPDMYTEKKPKKEKETFVTKEMLDKMGEDSDVTEKLADAAKPTKTKGKGKDAEPAKVVDPTEEYKMIKFATVDTEDSSRKVTMSGVSNVDGVVSALNHAIDVVSDAQYKYIRKECLSVSSDPEAQTVTITVNDAAVTSIATNERKNEVNLLTKYNVLLYSLFMYVKNHFKMNDTCVLSDATAKSIVHDMQAGNKNALRSLFPSGNDSSLNASKIIDVGVVKSILSNSGITNNDDLDNLAFAITQCTASLGDSKLNNGKTIADRDSQIAEDENDSEQIKSSKATLKSEFANERKSFNDNVALIAGSATNSSYDMYGIDTDEGEMNKIDTYVQMLDEGNVYEKIVDKLNSVSDDTDTSDDVKLTGSYAEDASRVVTSCEAILEKSDTTFKRKESKEEPVADLDYDSMLTTDSVENELASVPSNADFNKSKRR